MLSSNFGLLVASGLTLIFLWVVNNFRKKSANYWPEMGIPLAKTRNMILTLMSKDFNLANHEVDVYRRLKGHKVGGVMELWSPTLIILDLDLIKQICIRDFDYFMNHRGFDVEKQDPHMHFGLFNLTGDTWRSLRSKMSPTFTTGKIRRMFAIFESSCQKMVTALESKLGQDGRQLLEIRPFLQKLTMDVIAGTAFGIKTNLFEDPNSQFSYMGQRILSHFSGMTILKVVLVNISPKLGRLLNVKLIDGQADKFLSNVILQSLQRRMETGEVREDFLQLMIEARSGQIKKDDDNENNSNSQQETTITPSPSTQHQLELTDDVIIAQSLGFLVAGFDTIESFLSWAIYELAINQDVQEKLFEELKEKFDGTDVQFSYDHVNSLDYLDRVLSETLRKYPPALRTERKANAAYKISGMDITLPKDMLVVLPIYAIHHDPEYWPSPEKFDPERFTKENIARRHPSAYLPFGMGPRMCIANRFALTEGKAVIAKLVLNFKFEACDRTVIPAKIANSITLKHADDLWLSVTSRK